MFASYPDLSAQLSLLGSPRREAEHSRNMWPRQDENQGLSSSLTMHTVCQSQLWFLRYVSGRIFPTYSHAVNEHPMQIIKLGTD